MLEVHKVSTKIGCPGFGGSKSAVTGFGTNRDFLSNLNFFRSTLLLNTGLFFPWLWVQWWVVLVRTGVTRPLLQLFVPELESESSVLHSPSSKKISNFRKISHKNTCPQFFRSFCSLPSFIHESLWKPHWRNFSFPGLSFPNTESLTKVWYLTYDNITYIQYQIL